MRPSRTIRITAATEKALARIAAVTGFTPEDIISATVASVAAHVRREKEITLPLRILTSAETPVWLDDEVRQRLEAAAVTSFPEHVGGELLTYALDRMSAGEIKPVLMGSGVAA